MVTIGFVGYRGMVGSVLYDRMEKEGDFISSADWFCFSTSQHGHKGPFGKVQNANDVVALQKCDIILTCQGGDWTNRIYPALRNSGWNGYWIDASSALRMKDDSIIVLDPVNHRNIIEGLHSGIKNFIGGNCTVSLMLMAIHRLCEQGMIEWIISNTYQAASGAGAQNMKELISQTGFAIQGCTVSENALAMDERIKHNIFDEHFPKERFQAPLAFGWIPWIDSDLGNGQSREEWKGKAETNKILGNSTNIPVEGTCIRVPAMRCHGQALSIKLKEHVPADEITSLISSSHQWIHVVQNTKEATIGAFHPANISGTLTITVGRIRTITMGQDAILHMFTVGDQLLWGAAEPLRRILNIMLRDKHC